MYPNEKSEQSLKGDRWHEYMDMLITFGTLPLDCDPNAAEELEVLKEYVYKRVREMGDGTRTFVEKRLDIKETGEFGTADIIIVSPEELEVIDEKSGYVPVHIECNEQLLVYLLGAINLYGTRNKYRITIHQPGYDHVEGPIRSYVVSWEKVQETQDRIKDALNSTDKVAAGPWCKETYCPHRGACAAFHEYTKVSLKLGWHSSEVRSIADSQLALALDASDELGGYRSELRTEAMRRIMNMDREIHGYKVVKGRRSRAVLDERKLVNNVRDRLGVEWAARLFPGLSWARVALEFEIEQGSLSEDLLKCLGSPKQIEDVIKQYARMSAIRVRGGWKNVYEATVGPYIRETASGLTLEKAIDGRPAHKRGSEFDEIPADRTKLTNLNNVI